MFGLLGVAGERACVVMTRLRVRACAVIHGPIHGRRLQNFLTILNCHCPYTQEKQSSLIRYSILLKTRLGPMRAHRHMLVTAPLIKQGFRLTQTLVFSVQRTKNGPKFELHFEQKQKL